MKNLVLNSIIFTLFVGVVTQLNAQCPLSLSDLEKACVLSKNSFDTWALNKGYSQNPIKGDGQFDYVQYWCDDVNANGTQDQVGRLARADIKTDIGFTTTNKQTYLDFKTALTSKGYKFQYQQEQKVGGNITATYYYYSNGKYQVYYYSYYLLGITRYVMDIYALN